MKKISDNEYIFTQEEEENAKKWKENYKSIDGKQPKRFVSKDQWTGKLAELAVDDRYPELQKIHDDFEAEFGTYDFEYGKYKYDAKASNGDYSLRDYYGLDVNENQLKDHPWIDIYILSYYQFGVRKLTICGWVRKKQVADFGVYYKEEDILPGGRLCSANMWRITPKKLIETGQIPEKLPLDKA